MRDRNLTMDRDSVGLETLILRITAAARAESKRARLDRKKKLCDTVSFTHGEKLRVKQTDRQADRQEKKKKKKKSLSTASPTTAHESSRVRGLPGSIHNSA